MCTVPDTAVTLLNLQSKDTSSYIVNVKLETLNVSGDNFVM